MAEPKRCKFKGAQVEPSIDDNVKIFYCLALDKNLCDSRTVHDGVSYHVDVKTVEEEPKKKKK
jgi:hypothetical protein